MSELRKIVLILGNGFDLDLGLKTSYKDFWESDDCPKDYPAPLIKHLNQRWSDNLDAVKWYDLENELLNYYRLIPDPTIGHDFITEEERDFLSNFSSYEFACGNYNDKADILQSLVDKRVLFYYGPMYRIEVNHKDDCLQSPIWRDHKALALIKEELCKYLNSINIRDYNRESVALKVLFAAEKARESGDFLNIYTFNYTPLPVDYGNGFKDVVHYVHGNCESGKIIVGTKDDLSIDTNYDFLQKSFDPDYNPPAIVADLLEADEVIFFGHSIGENDRQYFKAFFKQQVDYSHPKRKDIIIFTKDEASKVQIKRSLQQMTDGNLSTLYCMNHIQIIKTADLSVDQKRMFDFLVNHHIERHHAEILMGKLLHE